MRTKLLPLMLGAALTLILAAAMACGSDDEAAPTPDTAAISAAVKAGASCSGAGACVGGRDTTDGERGDFRDTRS